MLDRDAILASTTISTAVDMLNDAPTSRFHRRAVIVSGVGFFTDAYDLFVISTVATLVTTQWHLSTTQTSWVTGSAILAAFFGAVIFGRIADMIGRRRVYAIVAGIMIVGAVGSAVAPNFVWLVIARFVLGLGIGGDYPVSAVLMSEYSNRLDRGRLVGLVFSMQALGLVVGPVVALALLGSGVGHALTWRLLLGFGAVPAAAVIYLRSKMPESPRFTALVKGDVDRAARDASSLSVGAAVTTVAAPRPLAAKRLGLREFLSDPRMLVLLLGTAGTWFLFDYAYYGNTLSLPAILKQVDGHAALTSKLAWTLAIFVVFAVPGYALAVWKMDRIGHRRLQLIGFAVLTVAFCTLGAVHELTATVGPFLAVFGLSYFFVEFGPNTTTFVLPSELFPTEARTTGHGIAAGVGKLGAFVGVFLVPQLEKHIGLRGMLLVAGGAAALGGLLTTVLPEPARRTLEEVSGELLEESPEALTGAGLQSASRSEAELVGTGAVSDVAAAPTSSDSPAQYAPQT
ncbi:MAG: major facilitator superfamily 1 [Acidimicrobiaceae bacterium]|nr:major facilitator superfamily 1 [Acidimicrobiaceae bacterium]